MCPRVCPWNFLNMLIESMILENNYAKMERLEKENKYNLSRINDLEKRLANLQEATADGSCSKCKILQEKYYKVQEKYDILRRHVI